MKYDPEIHHRRTIRLQDYDYTRARAYFVTVCAQGRECLFGGIADGEMVPNAAGKMVEDIWNGLPAHYLGIGIDDHTITPNHFHGIVWIVGAGPRACPEFEGHPQRGAPTMSLPDIVHRFKSLTTPCTGMASTITAGRRSPAACGSAIITSASSATKTEMVWDTVEKGIEDGNAVMAWATNTESASIS